MTEPVRTWEDAVRWLSEQPDQRELIESCYFDPPLARAARRYHDSAEWAHIRTYLPKTPGRALDIGAGNGIVSAALAWDGWQVTAAEPDPSALVGSQAIRGLAAEEGLAIETVETFGESMPFEDGIFDLVIARQVLHHAADLGRFCRELARLTRPGGRVLTLRDHVINGPEQLPLFLAKHPLHHLYGGENAFTRAQYRSALERAGFRIAQELFPFDGAINMAPLDETGVKEEIGARLARIPLIGAPMRGVVHMMPFPAVRAILNTIDRRPGRLHSYVCEKPR